MAAISTYPLFIRFRKALHKEPLHSDDHKNGGDHCQKCSHHDDVPLWRLFRCLKHLFDAHHDCCHVGIRGDQQRPKVLVPAIDKEDNKTTYEWFVNNPINNYNISVQIGNYVTVQDTFIKGSKVHYMDHYVLDYNEEVGKNYFLQAKEVIRFYEKYFGDYQWYDDGYKLIEVPYLGMEHQSAVTYGNGFSIYNGVRSKSWPMYGVMDPLIIHETGHQNF